MSSVLVRRQKFRKSPPQPLDRHLAEIDLSDGSIYINAGIDSTCCKKRARTIHKLTDGIVVLPSSTKTAPPVKIIKRTLRNSSDDLLSELSNDSSNDEQFDSMDSQSCSQAGK